MTAPVLTTYSVPDPTLGTLRIVASERGFQAFDADLRLVRAAWVDGSGRWQVRSDGKPRQVLGRGEARRFVEGTRIEGEGS